MHGTRTSLALLLLLAAPGAMPAESPPQMTVYRCEAGGKVTLQDEPCPAGQTQSTRSMTRPKDPPPRPQPATPPRTEPEYQEAFVMPPEPEPLPYPPPPMFQCTDYDGEVRYTEEYDPNTRCVPLSVLGYDLGPYPNAATCTWVHESCLRLDDDSACSKFKQKLKEEKSEAMHASASKAPFHKSEVERLSQIVAESCR